MYIAVPNRNSPPCILLREDHREGRKVLKKTLANLPKSKLAPARGLRNATPSTALAQPGDLGAVDEEDLYEAMDWLVQRQGRIEQKLASRPLEQGALILYD